VDKTVRKVLATPFAKDLIKTRQGRGGGQWKYVEGAQYINRLNDAFEGDWSFELVSHQIGQDSIVVHGRIRAGGVVKEAFGGSEITRRKNGDLLSIIDDLKSAATDALKKAASLLGLGLALYVDRLEVIDEEALTTPPEPRDDRHETPKESQLSAIHSLASKLGISPDKLAATSIKDYGSPPPRLSVADAQDLVDRLAKAVVKKEKEEEAA